MEHDWHSSRVTRCVHETGGVELPEQHHDDAPRDYAIAAALAPEVFLEPPLKQDCSCARHQAASTRLTTPLNLTPLKPLARFFYRPSGGWATSLTIRGSVRAVASCCPCDLRTRHGEPRGRPEVCAARRRAEGFCSVSLPMKFHDARS